jgi:Tol biopolymer transport system component
VRTDLSDLTKGAALLLLFVGTGGCSRSSSTAAANPWTVVAVRERRPGEVPFEISSGYLRESSNANYVPGPDSLVARVGTDSRGRPHVVIERIATGAVDTLFGGWASMPQWSPDGRYISCVAWTSRRAPHQLAVVDIATKTLVVKPTAPASGTVSKWSPDSHMIAASDVIRGSKRVMLYEVSVPEGKFAVLDSVDVLEAHDFSWSPNGRWLAYSRPTELDQSGEIILSADLWIADMGKGVKWPLLQTPDLVEVNPLWITDQTLQFDRYPKSSASAVRKTLVVELVNRGIE